MTEMSLAPPKQIRLMPSLNPIPVTLFLCSPPPQRCLPALAAPLAPLAASSSVAGRLGASPYSPLPLPLPLSLQHFSLTQLPFLTLSAMRGASLGACMGARQFSPPLHSTLPLPVSTGQTGRRHRWPRRRQERVTRNNLSMYWIMRWMVCIWTRLNNL